MSLDNITENDAAVLAGNPVDSRTEDIDLGGAGTEDLTEGAGDNSTSDIPPKKQTGFGKLFAGGKKSPKKKEKEEKGRNSEEEIRKLTRTELLELLIDETKEADRLREENERLRTELSRSHGDLDRVASFEAVIARLEAIVNGR